MKSFVFQFEVPGLLRLEAFGANEDRYGRYKLRIGAADDEAAKVEYSASVRGNWKVDGDVPAEGMQEVRKRPAFYESRYKVYCEILDKTVTDCRFFHPMASVSDSFDYRGRERLLDGELDFINEPGQFNFELELFRGKAKETVKVSWWVVSEKIDVCRDARLIKKRVDEASKGFVYSFLSKTKDLRGLSRDAGDGDQMWLDIFASFVDRFKAACGWVVNTPHLRYEKSVEYLRANRIRRWTPQQVNCFERTSQDLKEVRPFRTDCMTPVKDTVENRFVLFALKEMVRRLERILRVCDEIRDGGEGNGVSEAMLERIGEWSEDLNRLKANRFFTGIGRFTGFRQESLALERKRGYSTIYQTWIALKHAIDIIDGGIVAGNQPLWKLYEFWCFVTLYDILKGTEALGLEWKSGSLGDVKALDDVFRERNTEDEESGEEGMEKGGNSCRIVFEERAGRRRIVTLSYQQSYWKGEDGNLTNIVEQIPDIVLTIADPDAKNGEGSYTYLFDAKYRIYSSPSRKNHKWDAAPFETLNDMHRYRDAILYRQQKESPLSREVVGAYVLYPGREGDASYSYDKIMREENIGAIPLLPTDPNAEPQLIFENGQAVLRKPNGIAKLRAFVRKILGYQDSVEHLGDGKVLSTRGTIVIPHLTEGEYLRQDIVYGTFRGKQQLEWMAGTHFYNLPVDVAQSQGIDEGNVGKKRLLALVPPSPTQKDRVHMFRIVGLGSATGVVSREELKKPPFDYWREPSKERYYVWKVEEMGEMESKGDAGGIVSGG